MPSTQFLTAIYTQILTIYILFTHTVQTNRFTSKRQPHQYQILVYSSFSLCFIQRPEGERNIQARVWTTCIALQVHGCDSACRLASDTPRRSHIGVSTVENPQPCASSTLLPGIYTRLLLFTPDGPMGRNKQLLGLLLKQICMDKAHVTGGILEHIGHLEQVVAEVRYSN